MSTTFVLLLLLGTALGATHVNISIAQHPLADANAADITHVDEKFSDDLNTDSAEAGLEHNDNNDRSARLQTSEKHSFHRFVDGGAGGESSGRVVLMNSENSGFNSNGQSARVMLDGNNEQMQKDFNAGSSLNHHHRAGVYHQHHHHQGYSGSMSQQQQHSQLKQHQEQHKKNQEFERYIQKHHSGPTVETVFESASPVQQLHQAPASASSLASSSSSSSSSSAASSMKHIHARPMHVHKFERLEALPAATTQVLPAAEGAHTHTVVNHQPKPIIEPSQESVLPTASAGGDVHKSSNNYPDQTNYNQASSYGKTNFGLSPGYDQPQFNYASTHQPQYPPSVDEPQGGYGGYYGNVGQSGFYGGHQGMEYYPSQPEYQHPVVTKTIQIAQPALKAKKFEVRHPAIQKEFYDIEERVLIKPAGTVVVELDHPVAKIPKGETILPLGHPHPAVANQYPNHNVQGGPQHQYASSGSYASNAYNNQYSPSAVHNPHPMRDSTTIASSLTSSPTYDHNSKGAVVEANLNRQYNSEGMFVPENKGTESRQAQNDYYIASDTQGHQRQISSKNLSPKMISVDEPDARFDMKQNREASTTFNSRQQSSFSNIQNNDGSHFAYANEDRQAQRAFSPSQVDAKYNGAQYNYNGNNMQDQFQAEYINNNANNRESFKPARLRASAVREKMQAHVVKNEQTNIHLPPTQHNIYVSRLEHTPVVAAQQPEQQKEQHSAQLKSARFEEEAARVLEVKPFLQKHQGSVMVYAMQPMKSSARYSDSAESHRQTQAGKAVQIDQQRGQLRYGNEGLSQVQYSAPYSNMRHHPEQSARLTYKKLYVLDSNQPSFSYDRSAGGDKANLEVEKSNLDQDESLVLKNDKEDETKHVAQQAKAHIEIQIPHHPEEAHKPIIVKSAITPPKSQEHFEKYRTSAVTSSAKYTADAERIDVPQNFRETDSTRFGNLESEHHSKPDCDKATKQHSARYESVGMNKQPHHHYRGEQKFMRLIESTDASASSENSESAASASFAQPGTIVKPANIDVTLKSTAGHVATPGSRVIAATAAPTDASSHSESFHKRRIVVNHPFQTVREVVEHEPITNYHQVQVKEPASPALYREPYIQDNGAQKQYHSSSTSTHGNLEYAAPVGIPLHEESAKYIQYD